MSELEPVNRTCATCRETKPGGEFYRASYDCRPCARAKALQRAAAKRAELGDEEFLRRQREASRRYRDKAEGRSRNRASNNARNMALEKLARMYPEAFAHLLRLERSARGLPPDPRKSSREPS